MFKCKQLLGLVQRISENCFQLKTILKRAPVMFVLLVIVFSVVLFYISLCSRRERWLLYFNKDMNFSSLHLSFTIPWPDLESESLPGRTDLPSGKK